MGHPLGHALSSPKMGEKRVKEAELRDRIVNTAVAVRIDGEIRPIGTSCLHRTKKDVKENDERVIRDEDDCVLSHVAGEGPGHRVLETARVSKGWRANGWQAPDRPGKLSDPGRGIE